MTQAMVAIQPEHQLTLSSGDLAGYIQQVNSIPMLTPEE